MLATLIQHDETIDDTVKLTHLLVVLPKSDKIQKKYQLPGEPILHDLLARRHKPLSSISEKAVSANLTNGALCTWVMIDPNQSVFEQQTIMRHAWQLLLDENPSEIHIAVYGLASQNDSWQSWRCQLVGLMAQIYPCVSVSQRKNPLNTCISMGLQMRMHFLFSGHRRKEIFWQGD